MPELPEVLTTIKILKPNIISKTIEDFWVDKKTKVENSTHLTLNKLLKNKKITNISNIGKYIIIEIDLKHVLIIHQKLSGHLLLSNFIIKDNKWQNPNKASLINDPKNRFIRFALKFKNNKWLALSDSRRLARITLILKSDINKIKPIKQMGINPLSKDWTYNNFNTKLISHNIEIKKALLAQNIISGLGNIYSDEVLFKSKIKPTRKIKSLTKKEKTSLFKYIPIILKKALEYNGTTFDSYRNPNGDSGKFINFLNVYGRKNLTCKICKNKIESIKINGRTSYFCNKCQK